MASARYDLTEKVAPFLDTALLNKIREYNGTAPAPLASSGTNSEPSLTAAQNLYNSGKYMEAYKMLTSLKVVPDSAEEEQQAWGRFAAALLAFPDAPQTESKLEAVEEPKEELLDENKDEEDEEEVVEGESSQPPASVLAANEPNHKDPVMNALNKVQAVLDQRRGSDSSSQLNRRAWFIHWSLFAYFNGRFPKFLDTVFSSQNMSVIQAACPWVLRYVAIAVIAIHSRTIRYDRRIKDLIRVVQQELYEYSDPVLDFVQCLYIDYDFTAIWGKLDAAIKIIQKDFFAHSLVDKVTESARVLVADTMLRVHDYLPVATLDEALGLQGNTKWISEYIASKQEAKLDAFYDTEKNTVRVNYSKASINSQVSDKVKSLDHKAHLLMQGLKKTEV